MRWIKLLGLLSLLMGLLMACGGEGSADEPAPEIEGPALVMFYTDN